MSLILYLTGQTVTLYRLRRKTVEKLGLYDCDDSGYASLCNELRERAAAPVAVLADLIEEEFHEEILPHTVGPDRSKLHARHAGKLFRSTPFRYHAVIGRESGGRRDDRVLFSALTNRDNIEPLLDVLGRAGIPVKGVYSLPVLSRCLIRPLALKQTNALIVTEQPDGGLRESFVRHGHIRFSRLAPISEASPQDYCRTLAAEIEKTRRYLLSLRLLNPDEILDVYAVCDQARLKALEKLPQSDNSLKLHAVDIQKLGVSVGAHELPPSRLSDGLFCYLLYKHRLRNHYACGPHLRNWRTHQLRIALRAATWLIIVAATTLSGINLVDSHLMTLERNKLNQAGQRIEHAYDRVAQQLSLEPDQALAMREAIDIARHLQFDSHGLKQLYQLLGHEFSTQPDLVMDSLNWFTAAQAAAEEPPNEQRTVEERPYLIGRIRGHIHRFDGNYLAAQARLSAIAGQLAERPRVVSAAITRQPLDTRTDSDLQGTMVLNGDAGSAPFELRLVLEVGDEPV